MKSIAILSHKGGVGKTSIAVNIAVYLASRGKKVCLIDNDFHGPSIHTFFHPTVKWINSYLLADAKLEDSLQDFSSELNLAGKLYIGFADPSSSAIQKALQMDKDTSISMIRKYFRLKNDLVKEPYNIEYLIIDCSPGAVFSTINVMVATDSSLFIIKLSNADIMGTSQMIAALYEELKSRTLVLANFIPEDFIVNEAKTKEIQLLVEKLFTKDIGDKAVEFLGWIPQDPTLLNYEFEEGLKTIRGQESSRIIFTLNQPDHCFSQKIIDLIPRIFNEIHSTELKQDKVGIEVKQQKIYVVGEPAVGKTALYHAIGAGRVPEKLSSTTGIDRYTLWERMEGITLTGLNWWDFAGQYPYRDIHKLFLTEDAVYILVLNLRESLSKNHALYWLQSIREKAPQAIILPILTHYDEVKDSVLGLASTDDWQKLQEYLTTHETLEAIKVSNTDGTNIDKVEQTLRKLLNKKPSLQTTPLYLQLKEYIQNKEDEIFLSLEEVHNELKTQLNSSSENHVKQINEILNQLSNHGYCIIIELPSAPSVILFDVDRITKIFSLIIDEAKSLKGFVQEADIVDICADYFPRGKRREATSIIINLLTQIGLAILVTEKSETQRKISSWFIPHASEVKNEQESQSLYPKVFQVSPSEYGKTLAYFSFTLSTFDELIPSRTLGHLLHYIPTLQLNHIWRESQENSDQYALIAILYCEETPILHFRSQNLRSGKTDLKFIVTDESLEKSLFSTIIFALGKFKVSFSINETIFINTEKFKEKDENLLDRLNQLVNIPKDYLQTIQQAIKIYNSAPSSTIVTAVTAVEGLFVDLYTQKIGVPHPQMRFWEILKGLYELNYIPRTVKIWADTIRLHRNNCAHNINPVSTNDVIIVLEEILYILEWYNSISPN